jgi:hypothetical protein
VAPVSRPSLEPPALRASLASCAKFSAWLASAIGSGKLSPTRSRELNNALRSMLATLRQRHSEAELAEMRRLVVRAERAAERRERNVLDDRMLQDDEHLYRERPAVRPFEEPAETERPFPRGAA